MRRLLVAVLLVAVACAGGPAASAGTAEGCVVRLRETAAGPGTGRSSPACLHVLDEGVYALKLSWEADATGEFGLRLVNAGGVRWAEVTCRVAAGTLLEPCERFGRVGRASYDDDRSGPVRVAFGATNGSEVKVFAAPLRAGPGHLRTGSLDATFCRAGTCPRDF